MKHEEMIKLIEEVAQALQTAHIQLRVHRNILTFWSFGKLAREYSKAEDDIALSLDALVQYALSVDRQIDLTPSHKLNIGQTVEEVLVSDRAMVVQIAKLSLSASLGRSAGSALAGEVELLAVKSFAKIRSWQSFLDKQLELVRQMGLSSYLSVIAEANYRQNRNNSFDEIL